MLPNARAGCLRGVNWHKILAMMFCQRVLSCKWKGLTVQSFYVFSAEPTVTFDFSLNFQSFIGIRDVRRSKALHTHYMHTRAHADEVWWAVPSHEFRSIKSTAVDIFLPATEHVGIYLTRNTLCKRRGIQSSTLGQEAQAAQRQKLMARWHKPQWLKLACENSICT